MWYMAGKQISIKREWVLRRVWEGGFKFIRSLRELEVLVVVVVVV